MRTSPLPQQTLQNIGAKLQCPAPVCGLGLPLRALSRLLIGWQFRQELKHLNKLPFLNASARCPGTGGKALPHKPHDTEPPASPEPIPSPASYQATFQLSPTVATWDTEPPDSDSTH